jgi:hypothetical protein
MGYAARDIESPQAHRGWRNPPILLSQTVNTMNSTTRPSLLVLLLLASVTALSACATTGLQRSDRATATMDTVDSDINASLEHMSAAQASLDQLIRRGQTDVEGAFKTYSTEVDKLKQHGNQWIKNAEDMNRRGRQYFAEWAKEEGQYQNPLIQEVSEQRRADLGAVYDEIIEASQGVKEAMLAYISDHREIETFLSNDLTSKGIEAIAPLIPQVRNDGQELNVALTRVQAAIARANAEMTRAGLSY